MKTSPKIGIIYVPYTYQKYVDRIFNALVASDYPKENISLYIVPNGAPETKKYIEKQLELRNDLPDTHIIDDGINHGFAIGNNRGIKQAIADGCDYVFLNNGDLTIEKNTLSLLVQAAEQDENIACVQPLVLYMGQEDMVNTSGGEVHILGYAYARDNLQKIQKTYNQEITYSSGAASLYRSSILKEIGLLEKGFFMYHEDVELGLRSLLAGYKNILEYKAVSFHDYEFKRNPMKFGWMELYRKIVVFSYFKVLTLLLLLPLFITQELAIWVFALKGGWIRSKIWEYREWTKPKTWRLLFEMRRRAKRLRKISDKEFLNYFTGKIEAQEESNWLVEKIGNPGISLYFAVLKKIVIW